MDTLVRRAAEAQKSAEENKSGMSEQTGRHNPGGIRIEDALSILSTRARKGGNRSVTADAVPREMKEMGQTIDMDQPSTDADRVGPRVPLGGGSTASPPANPAAPETMSDDDRMKHDAMKAERERRGKEIREHMRTMDVADLLRMVFQAQQERVAAYKVFDRSVLLSQLTCHGGPGFLTLLLWLFLWVSHERSGLDTVLASGNITSYPTLCAKATATFSVLSDTINSVRSCLQEQHGRTDAARAVGQLQKKEGEKLNLTAAVHLERLRLRNAQVEGGESDSGGDERTAALLRQGIETLGGKVANAVEEINDCIEELRCIAADE